jgi:hypothetical protein
MNIEKNADGPGVKSGKERAPALQNPNAPGRADAPLVAVETIGVPRLDVNRRAWVLMHGTDEGQNASPSPRGGEHRTALARRAT